jgi:hypothetical protein
MYSITIIDNADDQDQELFVRVVSSLIFFHFTVQVTINEYSFVMLVDIQNVFKLLSCQDQRRLSV